MVSGGVVFPANNRPCNSCLWPGAWKGSVFCDGFSCGVLVQCLDIETDSSHTAIRLIAPFNPYDHVKVPTVGDICICVVTLGVVSYVLMAMASASEKGQVKIFVSNPTYYSILNATLRTKFSRLTTCLRFPGWLGKRKNMFPYSRNMCNCPTSHSSFSRDIEINPGPRTGKQILFPTATVSWMFPGDVLELELGLEKDFIRHTIGTNKDLTSIPIWYFHSLKFSQWYIGLETHTLVQMYRLRKGHQGTGKLGPIIHL